MQNTEEKQKKKSKNIIDQYQITMIYVNAREEKLKSGFVCSIG